MQVFELDYVIDYARTHCPYYREKYKDLPPRPALPDLPLVDVADYWSAARKSFDNVLTNKITSGKILQSGGTTGKPKFAVYSNEEWRTVNLLTAMHLPESGLRNGDILMNGFASGSLYASYDAVTIMHHYCPKPFVLLNIGLNAPLNEWANAAVRHQATLIASVPSRLMQFFEYVAREKVAGLALDGVYFAGEILTMQQREYINMVMGRQLSYRSMGYAGNDTGNVGYFAEDCGYNEHRVLSSAYVLEIIDPQSGRPIIEEGRVGTVYVTALYRLQMPNIRYPVGDMAMYTEPPGRADRKFILIGRNEQSIRVSSLTLNLSDIEDILEDMGVNYQNYQIVVSNENMLNQLLIRVVSTDGRTEEFVQELGRQRPLLAELVEDGRIHPIKVRWCDAAGLEYNPTTGKANKVLDKRLQKTGEQ